jgi:hypothetical protein
MGNRSFIAAAAASLVVFGPANASPWNRADGDLFVSTTADYYWSETAISRYSRTDSDTYVEFGATDDWMLGGRISYGTSISNNVAGTFTDTGLNEAEIGLQRQFRRGEHSATSFKVSVARSGSLSIDARTGAATPNMEFEIRALHGRDLLLAPIKIFATADTASRRRLGGDADQIRADTLVGIEPSKHFLLLLEMQSVVSLKNEDPAFADFDLYRGQASLVWRKSRRWSFIGGGRKEFSTRNLPGGTAVFIGVASAF